MSTAGLQIEGDVKLRHGNSIARKAENRFAESWIGLALEPCSRAPGIVRGAAHQAVAHGIFVYVAETGEIGALIRHQRIPILEPDPASGLPVEFVYRAGRARMQTSDHARQGFGSGGPGHEVVVVGKCRPSLKIPGMFQAQCQERVTEQVQMGSRAKKRLLAAGRRRHDIGSSFRNAVGRTVGPVGHDFGGVYPRCAGGSKHWLGNSDKPHLSCEWRAVCGVRRRAAAVCRPGLPGRAAAASQKQGRRGKPRRSGAGASSRTPHAEGAFG